MIFKILYTTLSSNYLKSCQNVGVFLLSFVAVAYSPRPFGAKSYGINLCTQAKKYMLFTYILGLYLAVADSRLPLSLPGGDAERFVSCDSTALTLAEE